MTRQEKNPYPLVIKRLDSPKSNEIKSPVNPRPPRQGDKARQEAGYMFWNDPLYKPTTKVCEDFWVEFMSAAKILVVFDNNKTKAEKDSPNYCEPDIYSVFNKMRQDLHDELPYSKKFITEIDKSVEREVSKEIGRETSKYPSRVSD